MCFGYVKRKELLGLLDAKIRYIRKLCERRLDMVRAQKYAESRRGGVLE
jgi:hypothetical protein